MGVIIAPVVGSGSWPACIARVSKPNAFSFDAMITPAPCLSNEV